MGWKGSLAADNSTAAPAIMSELTSRRQQRSISPRFCRPSLTKKGPLTPTLQSHACLFVAGFLFRNSKEKYLLSEAFSILPGARLAFNIT